MRTMRMSVTLLHAFHSPVHVPDVTPPYLCMRCPRSSYCAPARLQTTAIASRRAHMQRQREQAQRARTRQKIERSSSATVLGGWTDFCARHLCISKFSSMTSELYCFDQHRWRYNTSAYSDRFLTVLLTVPFFNLFLTVPLYAS